MTFALVSDVNYSEEVSDTTTHDVLVPANIQAGDLLMLFVALNGNTVTQPTVTGWTNIGWKNGSGTVSLGCWYKFAAGGETAFTYTSSVSEQSSNRTWRVTGAHASTPPECGVAGPDGFISAVSGNSLTPSWGAADTVWIIFGVNNSTGTVTGWAANYTDNQFYDNTGGASTGAGVTLASRNLNAATEAPGDITYSGSESRIGRTVAIRPSAAAASTTLDPFGMSGFFGG